MQENRLEIKLLWEKVERVLEGYTCKGKLAYSYLKKNKHKNQFNE